MTYADVTSANVVGYNNGTVTNGAQGVGGVFLPIGKKGTMRDLTVSGYGDMYVGGMITAAQLNRGGVQIKDMYWIDYEDYYGWYSTPDEEAEDLNNEPIEPGQGLWLNADQDGLVFQSSGEVNFEPTDVVLTNGAQLVCNACPRAVKMGEVEISGYGDMYVGGMITAAQLNRGGAQIQDMYWIDYEDYYGWYSTPDEEAEGLNGNELRAGACLWINVDQDGLKVTFPGPTETPVD